MSNAGELVTQLKIKDFYVYSYLFFSVHVYQNKVQTKTVVLICFKQDSN